MHCYQFIPFHVDMFFLIYFCRKDEDKDEPKPPQPPPPPPVLNINENRKTDVYTTDFDPNRYIK